VKIRRSIFLSKAAARENFEVIFAVRGRDNFGWRFLLIQEYSIEEVERDPREAAQSQKRLMQVHAEAA